MNKIIIIILLICSYKVHSMNNSEQNLVNDNLTGFYCLNSAEKKEIDLQFNIIDTIKAASGECLFENPINKVYLAIYLLKKGAYSKTIKSADQTYYNEFSNDQSVFNFFASRIKTISVENCKSLTIAYVLTGSKHLRKLSVCADTLTQLKISASSLAATLVHEARHIDRDDKAHFTCTQGTEKGREGSCDQSREQKGGYHYGVEYSIKVAKFGQNFHPAIYASLRADSINKLLNRFNQVPKIDTPQYALLRHLESQSIELLDDNMQIKKTDFIIKGQIFDRHQNSALVFNDLENTRLMGFDLYNGVQNNIGSFAESYNNLKIKPQNIDLFYSGYLYTASGYLAEYSQLIYEFSTPKGILRGQIDLTPYGKFAQFVQPILCNQDKNSLYLKNLDQQVFKISLTNNAQSANTPVIQQIENCQLSILSSVQFKNGKSIYLSDHNQLYVDTKLIRSHFLQSSSRYDFLSQPFSIFDFLIQQ